MPVFSWWKKLFGLGVHLEDSRWSTGVVVVVALWIFYRRSFILRSAVRGRRQPPRVNCATTGSWAQIKPQFYSTLYTGVNTAEWSHVVYESHPTRAPVTGEVRIARHYSAGKPAKIEVAHCWIVIVFLQKSEISRTRPMNFLDPIPAQCPWTIFVIKQ